MVSRHVNLVYATALRLAGGDAHRAKDVAQTVFVQLAQNAHKLSRESTLGGWLHRTTCNVASKALRTERRRIERETQAMLMNAQSHEGEARMETVAPILDEAINQLGEEDRAAILLRFFEQRDFRAVGLALGSNEDAARMRVNRALEKLQGMLKQKGVAFSTAALGTMLTASVVSSAPAGLSVSIATAALTTATGVTGTGVAGFLQIMTQTKAIIAGAVLVTGLAGTLVWQHQSTERMGNENASLKKETVALQAEIDSLKRRLQPKAATSTFTDQERTELLRLRGDVGLLRQDLAEGKRRQKELQETTKGFAAELGQEKVQKKEHEIAMIHARNAKQWMLAFYMYAAENNGRYPTTFDQATSFVNASFDGGALIKATNDFEIFPLGDRNAIDPGKTIALRGKARPLASGAWQRAYGLADGSAQIVGAPDGDFAAAEARYGFVYPPKPGQ
ncbi:MAG: sigma-70 family RNA polymerase sigma factor [Verrucomicrobiota bacterium]